MRRTIFASLAIMVLALSGAFAQSQTPVGHLQGGSPVLDIAQSTLEQAFESELNDGTDISASTVQIQQAAGIWWLTAYGTKSGDGATYGVSLSSNNGSLLISASAMRLCGILNCGDPFPCSWASCNEACPSNSSSVCQASNSKALAQVNHLGNFY